MKRDWKSYALLTLKGMSMGAADVVPGVSGGTIAFIVGIYKMFFSGKWKTFWKMINGNFLFFLILGIGISIFSLARLVTWLLTFYPILVWAFFFGLVLASTWFVGKDIKEWNWKTVLGFMGGTALAYYITIATPTETPTNLLFIFLCGAIAICAMILPGISGSFILVLLGKYYYIMDAIKTLNIIVLLVFAIGICVGITSFSRILSYALKHFRNITLSVLTGFMLGSLNKVWPWKETVETFVDSDGVEKPLMEMNVLPNAYISEAVILMIVGFLLIYILEKISMKLSK